MEGNNTKKLVILLEIDELKVIANNHYLMGKFNDAIKVAEKIIEIAEKAKLYSIVRENSTFIAEIYKKVKEEDKFSLIRDDFEKMKRKYNELFQKNALTEAHELISKFREEKELFMKLDDIDEIRDLIETDIKNWNEFNSKEKNLKKKLEALEIQLNSYLNTNNLDLAKAVLDKAKPLLKEIQDTNVLKMWETAEVMFIELKIQEDFEKRVHATINKVSILKDNYQFDKAKEMLEVLLKESKRKSLSKYISILEQELKNIVDTETKYKSLELELKDLENKVAKNVKDNLFKIAIDNINQIIKISRFIGKTQNLEKYTGYIEEIEQKIKRIQIEQDVSDIIKILNIKATQALKKGDFPLAIEKFEDIILKLKQIL
ncbi:MAG: hypothetical protein ACFFKA_16350 [Candidatus Thorarchaeota archaeon]